MLQVGMVFILQKEVGKCAKALVQKVTIQQKAKDLPFS